MDIAVLLCFSFFYISAVTDIVTDCIQF